MTEEIKKLIIYTRKMKKREPLYRDYPEEFREEIRGYLESNHISGLYAHQVEMFEKVRAGKNVVITTSTASGKTLAFLLPVLQEILEDPLTRAIFIYPTKALASDQYRVLAPVLEYFGEGRISAGVYDGDTMPAERSRVRKSANIILTNPEMLNAAFLPNHSKYGFDFIFANLKYIVIDELHSYRGAFGGHLANIFRRMKRILSFRSTIFMQFSDDCKSGGAGREDLWNNPGADRARWLTGTGKGIQDPAATGDKRSE